MKIPALKHHFHAKWAANVGLTGSSLSFSTFLLEFQSRFFRRLDCFWSAGEGRLVQFEIVHIRNSAAVIIKRQTCVTVWSHLRYRCFVGNWWVAFVADKLTMFNKFCFTVWSCRALWKKCKWKNPINLFYLTFFRKIECFHTVVGNLYGSSGFVLQ